MNFKRRRTIEENNELPKGTTIASQIQMSLDFHFTIVIMFMTSSAFGGVQDQDHEGRGVQTFRPP